LSGGIGGKTFTIVFGADGDVIDLTAPGMREETLAEIKKWIAEVHQYVPTVSLSVGETVVQPVALAVPVTLLPLGPFNIDGHVTMKLVSLEADGADRIAHCEQSYEVTVVQRPDATVPPVRYSTLEMTIRGSRERAGQSGSRHGEGQPDGDDVRPHGHSGERRVAEVQDARRRDGDGGGHALSWRACVGACRRTRR
jgi:hypothetical protein